MASTSAPRTLTADAFDPERPWRLHQQVALRDESFGALAYHYGNRRLIFLRSHALVDLIRSLADYATGREALEEKVTEAKRPSFLKALDHLVASEIIHAR